LSDLKSSTDAKGTIESLHHLIYVDIRQAKIKESILHYIEEQAEVQAAHKKINTKAGKRSGRLAWRKILSDVDDTLCCSGGAWPSGIDTSFPKKAIYPGVLAFYRELDLGSQQLQQQPHNNEPVNDEWDKSRIGNLVFLSARPHVYKDISENFTYAKLQVLQKERGLYTSPTMLPGSLDTGSQFMVKDDCEPIAQKKFENLREYLRLYPEFSCIFIGDNGQGDVRTAEMVFDDDRFRNSLHRVYIHQVQPLHRTHTKYNASRTRYSQSRNPNIFYFVTYVEAAIDAYHNALIRPSGLRRIMQEAVNDFLLIKWTVTAPPPLAITATAATNSLFSSTSSTFSANPPLQVMQSSSCRPFPALPLTGHSSLSTQQWMSPIGHSSRMGYFNPADLVDRGVRALSPDRFKIPSLLHHTTHYSSSSIIGSSSSSASNQPSSLAVVSNNKRKRSTAVETLDGLPTGGIMNDSMKREMRIRELNRDLEAGNAILAQHQLPAVDLLLFPQLRSIGSTVRTLFGTGTVVSFRSSDGIYEVHVYWFDRVPGEMEAGFSKRCIKVFLPGISFPKR